MTAAGAGAGASENRTSSAIRELGERITRMEGMQGQIVGRLDGLAAQLTSACSDMKTEQSRLDDHETRLRLREVAYQERILPALEKLDQLQLKVASSAVIGGSVTSIIAAIIFGVGKAAGWW